MFNNPSVVDLKIINDLPQSDVVHEMAISPTYEKTRKAFSEVNTGAAPGLDGIRVEVLLHGNDNGKKNTPSDFRCLEWHTSIRIGLMPFLCPCIKVKVKSQIDCLQSHICSEVILESQCK